MEIANPISDAVWLHQAISEEEVRQKMILEAEIVSEFEERDRREQRLADLALEERRLKEEERRLKEEAQMREAEARTLEKEACRREQAAMAEIAELKPVAKARKIGAGSRWEPAPIFLAGNVAPGRAVDMVLSTPLPLSPAFVTETSAARIGKERIRWEERIQDGTF